MKTKTFIKPFFFKADFLVPNEPHFYFFGKNKKESLANFSFILVEYLRHSWGAWENCYHSGQKRNIFIKLLNNYKLNIF